MTKVRAVVNSLFAIASFILSALMRASEAMGSARRWTKSDVGIGGGVTAGCARWR